MLITLNVCNVSNVYGEKKQEYDFQLAREGTKTAKQKQTNKQKKD